MEPKILSHIDTVLHHLYINPLERCNLKCKICYTRKTSPILSNEQILTFIDRYEKVTQVQTVTFCGGEVFALASFPELVNTLTDKGIFIQIITNGTIDRLDKFTKPNFVNLIVSLDGLNDYHDANRGVGNFVKSTTFMKKAESLGFHIEVFSILTKQNLQHIDEFESYMLRMFKDLPITYHPRKPPEYLLHHPVSNVVGEINGFDFLTREEMIQVMKERNVFPPKDLGCYQIAIMSDGKVFGCCEGVTSIGLMTDPIETLVDKLTERVLSWYKFNSQKSCLGCSQPEFMCGIKQYLELINSYDKPAATFH